jgi:hypothetical protein
VTVAAVIPRLATLRVRGKSYCAERLKEGGETASLWEEVRAALTATLITRQRRTFPMTISRFRRTYEPRRLRVQSEDRAELSGMGANPFKSVPMSVLATKGYIVPDESGTLSYHAPDVEVLLSDMFVRDHCFSLVEGNGGEAGRVGIAFRPTWARRVPDIEGVLWLDGATRELRRLEFNYTADPFEGLWQRFPSYMEYTRLPSGAWIIQRWAIRMPLVDVSRGDPTMPGANAGAPRRRLVAILEQGAEASIGGATAARTGHALAGIVFDSIARAPLANARVSLRGTPFAATSDADGRFRILVPDTGTYLLAFEHSRLDSLAYDVPAQAVRVADTLVVADVAVPPLARVRAALCPDSRGLALTGVVVGAVRTPAGTAAAWTTLRYRWSRYEPAESGGGAARPTESAPVLQGRNGRARRGRPRSQRGRGDIARGDAREAIEPASSPLLEHDVHRDSLRVQAVEVRAELRADLAVAVLERADARVVAVALHDEDRARELGHAALHLREVDAPLAVGAARERATLGEEVERGDVGAAVSARRPEANRAEETREE